MPLPDLLQSRHAASFFPLAFPLVRSVISDQTLIVQPQTQSSFCRLCIRELSRFVFVALFIHTTD